MFDQSEFYGCPEYVVNHHRTEQMSLGIRVYHWRKLGNLMVPQFTAVLSPLELAAIAKDVHQTAMKALAEGTPTGVMRN